MEAHSISFEGLYSPNKNLEWEPDTVPHACNPSV
jgi:hypothetical protein